MLLNIDDVAARTRLGKSTIRKLAAEGAFPAARQLVGRKKVWVEQEVTDWLIKTLGLTAGSKPMKAEGWLSAFTGRGDRS